MFNEDGLLVDSAEVCEAVSRADVLIVGFPSFPRRLLIDSRTAGEVGPMVRIVEPLAGVDQRMFWLGRHRPQFEMPQRFTFFVWPHSLSYLHESGVVDAMRASISTPESRAALDTAMDKLHAMERDALRSAVNDGPWRTLWHASGATHGA